MTTSPPKLCAVPHSEAPPVRRAAWRDYAPAGCALLLGILGLIIATLMPGDKGGQYAVIAPPWFTLAQRVELIRQAQGGIADMRGDRHIVIAQSDDPAFVDKLYEAGAWLVVNPLGLHGCGENRLFNRSKA